MYHRGPGDSKSEIIEVPKKAIPIFRKTSENSVLKALEKRYALNKKEVQKTPLIMTMEPTNGTKLKELRNDIQNGNLSKLIMSIVSKESFFKSRDTWKVLPQINFDELEQVIEQFNSKQGKDDEEEDESEDESEESDYEEESNESDVSDLTSHGRDIRKLFIFTRYFTFIMQIFNKECSNYGSLT